MLGGWWTDAVCLHKRGVYGYVYINERRQRKQMSKVKLLKDALVHVSKIINNLEFTDAYVPTEQAFFISYKRELEQELEQEENQDDSEAV